MRKILIILLFIPLFSNGQFSEVKKMLIAYAQCELYNLELVDSVSVTDVDRHGLAFSADSSKMYQVTYTTSSLVQGFDLSTPGSISTATHEINDYFLFGGSSVRTDIEIQPNGAQAFICNSTDSKIEHAPFGTYWDITTITPTWVTGYDTESVDTIPVAFCFGLNGTKAYILGDENDAIYEYNLSTAYDLTTMSLQDTLTLIYPGSYLDYMHDINISENGSYLFVDYGYRSTQYYLQNPGELKHSIHVCTVETNDFFARYINWETHKLYILDLYHDKVYEFRFDTNL